MLTPIAIAGHGGGDGAGGTVTTVTDAAGSAAGTQGTGGTPGSSAAGSGGIAQAPVAPTGTSAAGTQGASSTGTSAAGRGGAGAGHGSTGGTTTGTGSGSTQNRSSAGRGGSSGRTGSSPGSGNPTPSPTTPPTSNAGNLQGKPPPTSTVTPPPTTTTPSTTPPGNQPKVTPKHPHQQRHPTSPRRTTLQTTRPATTAPPAATTSPARPTTIFGSPALVVTPPAAGGPGTTPRPANPPAPTEGQGNGGASGIGSAPATLGRDVNRIVRVVPVWAWIMLGVLAAFGFLSATLAAAFARRARYADALVGRIRTAAITDPLTGLLNRRGFAEALEHEIARARRFEHPLAVAFLDVRGLKNVNDDFGHQAGDDLLKAVGGLLRRTSRQADIVARVGGDECAVALIEQDRAGAVAFARRIAAEVPHTRAELGVLADWDLTVGVAVFPEDGETGEELLAAADRRLYMRRGIALQPGRP